MTPYDSHSPDSDIDQALHQLNQPPSGDNAHHAVGDVAVAHESESRTWLHFALCQCSMMATKCPWQTLGLLMLSVGCGWICSYFGATVFLGMIIYAVNAEP